jgi:hypothetical protein
MRNLREEKAERIWTHSVLPALSDRFFDRPQDLKEFEYRILRNRTVDEKVETESAAAGQWMRQTTLEEFRRSEPVALSANGHQALARLYPGMRIEPSAMRDGEFHLTPDQHVGMVCLPELTIEVLPKIPIASVLFLIAYACEASIGQKTSGNMDVTQNFPILSPLSLRV